MFATKTALYITKNTHIEARWCLWGALSSAGTGALVNVEGIFLNWQILVSFVEKPSGIC